MPNILLINYFLKIHVYSSLFIIKIMSLKISNNREISHYKNWPRCSIDKDKPHLTSQHAISVPYAWTSLLNSVWVLETWSARALLASCSYCLQEGKKGTASVRWTLVPWRTAWQKSFHMCWSGKLTQNHPHHHLLDTCAICNILVNKLS